jgi:hypothetical protein
MTLRQLSFHAAHAALRSFGVKPLQTVFIMGHMRSGSTLLLHILLTNPELIGCGERNTPYRSAADLDKLEIAARIAQFAPFRRVRYAVDQINHNQFTPNLELLEDKRVRCIFLIREPKETIQSILNLTRDFYEQWTIHQAVEYYSRRLETLAECASRLNERNETLAVTYNDLVAATLPALRRLELFLGLEVHLREEYTIQRFTMKRGDPSGKIGVGRIVRERRLPPVDVPEGELDQAFRAYQNCMRVFNLEPPRPGPSHFSR